MTASQAAQCGVRGRVLRIPLQAASTVRLRIRKAAQIHEQQRSRRQRFRAISLERFGAIERGCRCVDVERMQTKARVDREIRYGRRRELQHARECARGCDMPTLLERRTSRNTPGLIARRMRAGPCGCDRLQRAPVPARARRSRELRCERRSTRRQRIGAPPRAHSAGLIAEQRRLIAGPFPGASVGRRGCRDDLQLVEGSIVLIRLRQSLGEIQAEAALIGLELHRSTQERQRLFRLRQVHQRKPRQTERLRIVRSDFKR